MSRDQGKALIEATKRAAAASLAGGIIAASGRPHSVAEASEVVVDAYHRLFPDPNDAGYQEWLAKDRAAKVRS